MRIKKSFFIGFVVVSLGLYAVIAVGIGVVATRDTKIRSDGILVLGAKAYHGKAYNPCLVAVAVCFAIFSQRAICSFVV